MANPKKIVKKLNSTIYKKWDDIYIKGKMCPPPLLFPSKQVLTVKLSFGFSGKHEKSNEPPVSCIRFKLISVGILPAYYIKGNLEMEGFEALNSAVEEQYQSFHTMGCINVL